MSVRATPRLIGDIVITPGLPNGPKMIVQSVDDELKLVTTVWFAENQLLQVGVFPSSALERYEAPPAAAPVKAPSTRGRKPAQKK